LQVAESQQPLPFSSLGRPRYEYAFDGYCAGKDPGRLLVLLRRIAGRP
jgi:hypothetical protein